MRRSLGSAGQTIHLHVVVLLLVVVALLASACDTGSPATTGPATPAGNNPVLPPQNPAVTAQPYTKVNQVGIILKDDSILPNNLSLPSGKVRFTVTNQGTAPHDLVISNDSGVIAKTAVFSKADGAKTLDATLQPGSYKLSSDAPGDADKGITGTLDIK